MTSWNEGIALIRCGDSSILHALIDYLKEWHRVCGNWKQSEVVTSITIRCAIRHLVRFSIIIARHARYKLQIPWPMLSYLSDFLNSIPIKP